MSAVTHDRAMEGVSFPSRRGGYTTRAPLGISPVLQVEFVGVKKGIEDTCTVRKLYAYCIQCRRSKRSFSDSKH